MTSALATPDRFRSPAATLAEVLAVVRARAGVDFMGYRQATLDRRARLFRRRADAEEASA